MWSHLTPKYIENIVNGTIASVTLELLQNNVIVHSQTITEQEYQGSQYNLFFSYHLYSLLLIHCTLEHVYSSAPKLAWTEFVQVLKIFMLANKQEHEFDIERAFNMLDQQKKGLYGRPVNIPDGKISPDELRAFLSILTDEVVLNLIKEGRLYLPLIIVSFSTVLIFVPI